MALRLSERPGVIMSCFERSFARRFRLSAVSPLALAALVAGSPALAQVKLADIEHWSWPTISAGASISGSLDSSDVLRDDGTYADGFYYDAEAGETVTITMRSADFDSWLILDDPNSALMLHDDDSAGGHDARLTETFPRAGRYLILANVLNKGGIGHYTLTLTSDRRGSGAATASNQGQDEQWARCSDDGDKYPLDVQVGGCTALLQSGQLSNDNLAIAYVDRAITFEHQHNYDRAVADFTDALRLKPDYALAFAERGHSELQLKRFDSAETDFAAALRADPKNAVALNGQGRMKMRSNDYAQARDLFTQAIASDSTDATFFANRAAASDALGDHDQALADFTQALRINPADDFALSHRAATYRALHRYSEATADVDRMVELDPSAWNHSLACWERAAFLGQELDRARTECDKAVALDATNAEILDSRGMLRLKLKQYQGAWSDYNTAIRLDPGNASYWYGRAMAERGQGKTAAARADITKASALDPKIAETYATYGFKP